MCAECAIFGGPRPITTPAEMHALHELLYFKGLKPGVLERVVGSLQWADFIDCTLRCRRC